MTDIVLGIDDTEDMPEAAPALIDDRTRYSGRTFYAVLVAAVCGAVWATSITSRLETIERSILEDRIRRSEVKALFDRLGDKNPTIIVPQLEPEK